MFAFIGTPGLHLAGSNILVFSLPLLVSLASLVISSITALETMVKVSHTCRYGSLCLHGLQNISETPSHLMSV